MSDDRLALLAAVCAAPDDDAPRLLYADALDEAAGEPTPRAMFVRLQIELVRSRHQQTPPGRQRLKQQERRLFSRLDFGLPARWDWGIYLKDTQTPHRDRHVVIRRGFVASVTCTAADWILVGDALSWAPGQTVPCAECEGTGRQASDRNSEDGYDCIPCSGTGRVPRPCPPTAMPLKTVRLTTDPDLSMRTPSRIGTIVTSPYGRGPVLAELSARWPAVKKWELPPPAVVEARALADVRAGQLVYWDDERQGVRPFHEPPVDGR